jgi:hypothetical protein
VFGGPRSMAVMRFVFVTQVERSLLRLWLFRAQPPAARCLRKNQKTPEIVQGTRPARWRCPLKKWMEMESLLG